MRRLAIIAATVAGLLPLPATAAEPLTRRPVGSYQRHEPPGRCAEVRPVPGTGRAAVYDQAGRRVGTVERKPYGGAAFYDHAGRRR